MQTQTFFSLLWQDYIRITPQAEKIHDLFTQQGETVVNDHVAFRSFSDSPVDLAHLEPVILSMGYQVQQQYLFEQKKLVAKSYSHPEENAPRIFISEIQRHQLSTAAQQILEDVVAQIPQDVVHGPEVLAQGLLWQPVMIEDYEQLLQESEYAAWLVSMGLRANHFTVAINQLQQFNQMEQVIELLESNGYALNQAGGTIKGTAADLLVQASTLADKVEVAFAKGQTRLVPSCFYEFAQRYPDANEQLFDRFIATNADKIFESTHAA